MSTVRAELNKLSTRVTTVFWKAVIDLRSIDDISVVLLEADSSRHSCELRLVTTLHQHTVTAPVPTDLSQTEAIWQPTFASPQLAAGSRNDCMETARKHQFISHNNWTGIKLPHLAHVQEQLLAGHVGDIMTTVQSFKRNYLVTALLNNLQDTGITVEVDSLETSDLSARAPGEPPVNVIYHPARQLDLVPTQRRRHCYHFLTWWCLDLTHRHLEGRFAWNIREVATFVPKSSLDGAVGRDEVNNLLLRDPVPFTVNDTSRSF